MGMPAASAIALLPRLDDIPSVPTYSIVDDRYAPFVPGPLGDGLTSLWQKGVAFARNVAISGALAGIGGIALGAMLTDNWLAQIFVTMFAAFILWIPMLVATIWVSRRLGQRRRPVLQQASPAGNLIDVRLAASWHRLSLAAPRQRDRIVALERSLERSRTSFAGSSLDADAHELCAMIDRRLPDLIDHELDSLAPDSRGRDSQVGELVDLVEQFVRHCGNKRDGAANDSAFQAEVLKRRFEARLNDDSPFDH